MSFTDRIFVLNIPVSGTGKYFIQGRSSFRLLWEDMLPSGYFLAECGDLLKKLVCLLDYTLRYLTKYNRYPEKSGLSCPTDSVIFLSLLFQTSVPFMQTASRVFSGMRTDHYSVSHHRFSYWPRGSERLAGDFASGSIRRTAPVPYPRDLPPASSGRMTAWSCQHGRSSSHPIVPMAPEVLKS